MKKNVSLKKVLLKMVSPAAAIVGLVCAISFPVSCAGDSLESNPGSLQKIQGDCECPSVEDFNLIDSRNMEIKFSEPVKFNYSYLEGVGVEKFTVEFSEDRKTAKVSSLNDMDSDYSYAFKAEVEDDHGNTLMFIKNFQGFNNCVPILVFSEIRNAYGTQSVDGKSVKKGEFVEFYALSSGKLSGLELVSVHDGEARAYKFPSESFVPKGSYLTVHLRKVDNGDRALMVDECSFDYDESKAIDSSLLSVDFWSENEKACIGDTDILMLRNSATGDIIDCFAFVKNENRNQWDEDYDQAAAQINAKGLWLDENGNKMLNIDSAFCSDAITSSACTRTISRQNIEQLSKLYADETEGRGGIVVVPTGASEWIVTKSVKAGGVTSPGATPGFENSTNRY